MKRHQISTTVPPRTKEQFEELRQLYGTATAVLTVAIDRLYQAEAPSDEDRLRAGATNVPCAKCGQPIDPASAWLPGTFGEAYCPQCQEEHE